MTFSEQYGWCVYGVDGEGKPDGIATNSEAEAVSLFWKLADSHSIGKVAFYNEDRTLWLDENTRLVTMNRVDIGRAQALLARRRREQEAAHQPVADAKEGDVDKEATA